MYTRRVQIVNYGPIDQLEIDFPFDGESPQLVVFVGENGSGKSILLSHIVNGLISAKGIVYPDAAEVEPGRVYKLRANSYIKSGREYYFSRVDYDNDLYVREIRSRYNKEEYDGLPAGLSGADIEDMWENVGSGANDDFDSNIRQNNRNAIEGVLENNCVLYFPFNRHEEPGWLNVENLNAQARYMDLPQFQGYTISL